MYIESLRFMLRQCAQCVQCRNLLALFSYGFVFQLGESLCSTTINLHRQSRQPFRTQWVSSDFDYFIVLGRYQQKQGTVYRVRRVVPASSSRSMVVAWSEFLARNVAIALYDIKLFNTEMLVCRQGRPSSHPDERRSNSTCPINVERLQHYPVLHFLPLAVTGVDRHELVGNDGGYLLDGSTGWQFVYPREESFSNIRRRLGLRNSDRQIGDCPLERIKLRSAQLAAFG